MSRNARLLLTQRLVSADSWSATREFGDGTTAAVKVRRAKVFYFQDAQALAMLHARMGWDVQWERLLQ